MNKAVNENNEEDVKNTTRCLDKTALTLRLRRYLYHYPGIQNGRFRKIFHH